MPGEWYAPTQPIPEQSRRPTGGPAAHPDEVIDFTPELRAQAIENMKRYKWGGNFPFSGTLYNPPIVGNVNGTARRDQHRQRGGGTNWPGGRRSRDRHRLRAGEHVGVHTGSVAPPPAGSPDIPYQAGVVGQPFRCVWRPGTGTYADVGDAPQAPRPPAEARHPRPRRWARTARAHFNAVEGLSMVKPPYGVMSGDRSAQRRAEVAGAARRHARTSSATIPKLKGLTIPKTGQGGSVGVLVTKTLVIAGDPQVTTTPKHPRGAMMRAYDKQTGEEVGAVWMPAPVSGSPMTYRSAAGSTS